MILILLLAFSALADDSGGSYKMLNDSCKSCVQIDGILSKHNTQLSPDKRIDLALNVASEIRKMKLKGKPEKDQKREIYYAINGTVQVLADDFDSETVIRLIDLRAQSPKNFDYVFWRFNMGEQQKIVERMKAAKADNLRPKAVIPKPKSLE